MYKRPLIFKNTLTELSSAVLVCLSDDPDLNKGPIQTQIRLKHLIKLYLARLFTVLDST